MCRFVSTPGRTVRQRLSLFYTPSSSSDALYWVDGFFFKFILLFSSASRLTNNTGVSTSCEWWVERGGVGTTLFMCSPKEEDKEVHPERTKKGHYEWNARLVWNERRKKGIVVSVLFRNAPHYIRSSRPSMMWTEQRWWPPARDAIVNDPRPLHPMWSFYLNAKLKSCCCFSVFRVCIFFSSSYIRKCFPFFNRRPWEGP